MEQIWETLTTYWPITLTAAAGLLLLHRLGLFSRVQAKEDTFLGGIFFFKDLQKRTRDLHTVFAEINADLATFNKTLPKRVFYPVGAIYYDDPNSLEDEA